MWILVFGGPPYFGDGPEDIMKNILREPRRAPKGNKVSSQCLELLNGMLNKDPEKRLSAAQCLKVTFFFWNMFFGYFRPTLPVVFLSILGLVEMASRNLLCLITLRKQSENSMLLRASKKPFVWGWQTSWVQQKKNIWMPSSSNMIQMEMVRASLPFFTCL